MRKLVEFPLLQERTAEQLRSRFRILCSETYKEIYGRDNRTPERQEHIQQQLLMQADYLNRHPHLSTEERKEGFFRAQERERSPIDSVPSSPSPIMQVGYQTAPSSPSVRRVPHVHTPYYSPVTRGVRYREEEPSKAIQSKKSRRVR